MITIHGYSPSGNCHKLRMLLGHLGREHRWVETDSAHGATRTAEYLAKNPNGKVPMLETEDGRILVESNAILVWLAEGTRYFAGDAWQRAQTLSWMFFEQYSHEPYIAVARFICGWTALDSERRKDLPQGAAAYRKLNQLALQLAAENALLVSCSCSWHLPAEALPELLQSAAQHAGRTLRLIASGGQSPDHPVHPAMPETRYLKAVFGHVSR